MKRAFPIEAIFDDEQRKPRGVLLGAVRRFLKIGVEKRPIGEALCASLGIGFIVHQSDDRPKEDEKVGAIDHGGVKEHQIIRGKAVCDAINHVVERANDDCEKANSDNWLRSDNFRETRDENGDDRAGRDECDWERERDVKRDSWIFVKRECEEL